MGSADILRSSAALTSVLVASSLMNVFRVESTYRDDRAGIARSLASLCFVIRSHTRKERKKANDTPWTVILSSDDVAQMLASASGSHPTSGRTGLIPVRLTTLP